MTETEIRQLIEKRRQGFTGYSGVVIDEAGDGLCRAHVELEAHHLNPSGPRTAACWQHSWTSRPAPPPSPPAIRPAGS